MKKLYIVLIIIFGILLGLTYFFSVSGIQTLSTDKKVYSQGEDIQIYWTDFSFESCMCRNKEIQIFKQKTTGWKKVQKQLYGFNGEACVNGEMVSLPMPCDVLSCRFSKPKFKSGNFTWNSKIYERKGLVESCLNSSNNEVINRTMQSYDLKNASPGKYKISFGSASKIIEIK